MILNNGVVNIGISVNANICVWLDERDAIDMAEHYGPNDEFSGYLMEAVELAYPKDNDVQS